MNYDLNSTPDVYPIVYPYKLSLKVHNIASSYSEGNRVQSFAIFRSLGLWINVYCDKGQSPGCDKHQFETVSFYPEETTTKLPQLRECEKSLLKREKLGKVWFNKQVSQSFVLCQLKPEDNGPLLPKALLSYFQSTLRMPSIQNNDNRYLRFENSTETSFARWFIRSATSIDRRQS